MQHSEGTKNWFRLVALSVISGMALISYSYAITWLSNASTFENSFSLTTWIVPLAGFGATALAFIFSLNNVVLRNAAVRGIGVAAVMAAPLLGFNFIQLSSYHHGNTGSLSLFHLGSLVICLLIWGILLRWRPTDPKTERLSPEQPITARSLFWTLMYLLLLGPFFFSQLGVDLTYELTKLPADVSGLPHDAAAQAKVFQQDMVLVLTHSMTRIIERSQGILALVMAVGLLLCARRNSQQRRALGVLAPFPSRQDTLLLVIYATSALVFVIACQALMGMSDRVAQALQSVSLNDSRSVEQVRISTLFISFLPGFVFIVSGLLIAGRLFRAPQLRTTFSLVLLFCSLGFAATALHYAMPSLRWIGYVALITSIVQGTVFWWRRGAWVTDHTPDVGITALEAAQWGAFSLSILGGSVYAVAIIMAYVSVADISYLLSWSEALKNGGHAPLDKIFLLFAPSVFPNAFLGGPAFFTLCLFLSSTASLLVSLFYGGVQGCMKGIRSLSNMPHPPLATTSQLGRQ